MTYTTDQIIPGPEPGELPRAPEGGGATALIRAATRSLAIHDLLVRDTVPEDPRRVSQYVRLHTYEECGCGHPNNHREFVLTVHICGPGSKPREVMRLTDDAERAALTVGSYLETWHIVEISTQRSRVLRQRNGAWTGCLSFRALMARDD